MFHELIPADLSPNIHPAMGGILWSFEPVWLRVARRFGVAPWV